MLVVAAVGSHRLKAAQTEGWACAGSLVAEAVVGRVVAVAADSEVDLAVRPG